MFGYFYNHIQLARQRVTLLALFALAGLSFSPPPPLFCHCRHRVGISIHSKFSLRDVRIYEAVRQMEPEAEYGINKKCLEQKKQLKAQRGNHWRLTRMGAQETRHTKGTGDHEKHDRT